MAQVTAPVILDSTGQQIVTALQNLNSNVKPTADEIKRTSSNNQTVEAALLSLNSQLAVKQYVIPADVTANINSVATLNSALESSSMNTMQFDASQRPSLVSAGLIPVNAAGLWTVRKLSSNYMFMEYQTYTGYMYYANINGGTLSSWTEATTDVRFAALLNDTIELNVSNSLRAMMMVAGNSTGVRGIVNLASSGTGSPNATNIGGDTSGLTFSHTTNKISITFANPAQCMIFVLNGTVTVGS